MTSPIQLASVASLPHSQQAQTNAISNPWPQGSASTHQNSQNFLAQPFQPYVAPVSSVTASATLLEQADKEPWRYRGYPAMCTWMASDDDFFVLRRFGKLGARVALYMQDQISALEEDLQIEDNLCRTAVKEESDSGTFRKDPRQLRQQIMNQLCIKLEQYRMDFDMIDPMIWITGMLMDAERFILDHSTLKARPVASDFQIRNVNRWLEASNGAISEKEIQYIRREEDLIPLVSKTKTPLRRFIDRFQIVRRIPCFRNRKLNNRLYNPDECFEANTTIYNTETRIDKFVTCAAIVIGLGMLIAPLWILQHISFGKPNLQKRLVIITLFMVIFTIMLSVVTVAKPFEALGATAAYGAILMVFMQLNSIGT